MVFGRTRNAVQASAGLLITALLLNGNLFGSLVTRQALAQSNSSSSSTTSTEVKQIQNAIADTAQEILQIEREIQQYRNEAAEVAQEKRTLESVVRQIESERNKLDGDVRLTEKQIDKTNLSIDELRRAIAITDERTLKLRGAMAEQIRRLYRADTEFSTEVLLFNDSPLSTWVEVLDRGAMVQGALQTQVQELRELEADLQAEKRSLQSEQAYLEDLRQQAIDKKDLVEQQKSEQEALLRETRNEEAQYQQLIAEREALRKAFEAELFEYESQLRFALDPTALPKKGTAPLSWPLDKIVVTQLFGAKTGPHRTYQYGHSGVDFRGNGDPVYAMADGVVQGTGNTDEACRAASFGKWVFIKYDNNLASTYGHLSIISVRPGQRVKRGQLVGYSGNTGRSTAPHLHVSLYAAIDAYGNNPVQITGQPSKACKGATLVQPRASRDAYLDPLDYLPPTTNANFKPGVR